MYYTSSISIPTPHSDKIFKILYPLSDEEISFEKQEDSVLVHIKSKIYKGLRKSTVRILEEIELVFSTIESLKKK